MGSILNTLLSISLLVCVMDEWSDWGECKFDEDMDGQTCYKTRDRDVLRSEGAVDEDNSCIYEEEEEECDCGILS